MKKIKKTLVSIIASLLVVPTFFVGCGGGASGGNSGTRESSSEYHSSSSSESASESTSKQEQTMLYIGNYDGGMGHVWLDHLIAGFEEKYKDVSFETGKMGVKIVPENNKDLGGATLINTISSKVNDIYFTESADYYAFLDKGYMLDITDLMTAENPEDNNKTIVSKLTAEQDGYYKTDEDKYYAVPHYAGFSGLMYDIDAFEAQNLYLSGENKGHYVKSATEKRSNGPDGAYGTYDDGLPATYDEFFAFLDYLGTTKSIVPFVFTGQYPTYLNWLISALYVDYEGKDNLNAMLKLDGSTCDNIVKVNNGVIGAPESVALTTENANLMFGTQGKLEALKFVEKILTNSSYYYQPCVAGTYTQRNAQSAFLKGGVVGTSQQIAFLAEGIWWEEEANGDFGTIVKAKGDKYSRANRNLGIFPLPKANANKVGEKTTLVDINKSTAFIYSGINPNKIDLAKKFLAYACRDEALRDFTLTTDCPKALSYDMGDDYENLSKYGKNVWTTYSNSDYVLHYSPNVLYKNALADFEMFKAGYLGNYGNQPSTVLCSVTAGESSMTAEEVFKDIVNYHSDTWYTTYFGKYIQK